MTVGVIDFQGAPTIAVVDYLVMVTKRPIILSPNIGTAGLYYRSPRDQSVEEAIAGLTGAFASNGLAFVDIDSRYYRLLPFHETNNLPENPHIEIRIEKNELRVEDQLVAGDDLIGLVKKQLTPAAELWIFDAQNSTNANFNSISMALVRANLKAKIYQAYIPH